MNRKIENQFTKLKVKVLFGGTLDWRPLRAEIDKLEKEIDWNHLKDAFYKECTTDTTSLGSIRKIEHSPSFVFNWFKNEILEYLK